MSDIYVIKHLRVGTFLGIPVYMLLEDGCWLGSKKFREPSYVAYKKAISIGGGSGEHPALVINDPACCVAIYLRHAGLASKSIDTLAKRRTSAYMTYCDGMTAAQWKAVFQNDFAIWKTSLSFDRWVATCIGEFIFFMLHEEYPEIRKWRRYAKDLCIHLCQVQIPWDDYGGNGTDYFEVKQRRPPNQALLAIGASAPQPKR